jgi:hypothetical protein
MITTKIALVPFTVPNYVRIQRPPGHVTTREDGFPVGNEGTFILAELDEHTLSELCDQFRKDCFKKAGKTEPRAICCKNEPAPQPGGIKWY